MRTAVFSTKAYDRQFLRAANEEYGHELHFLEPRCFKTMFSINAAHMQLSRTGLMVATDAAARAGGRTLSETQSVLHRPLEPDDPHGDVWRSG